MMFICFSLIHVPLHAQTTTPRSFVQNSDIISNYSVQEILEKGLSQVKSRRDRVKIKRALRKLKSNQALSNATLGGSMDLAAYYLLYFQEKDFIRFPSVYHLYLQIKSVVRGKHMIAFNQACVYGTKRAANKAFKIRDLVSTGNFGCGKPAGSAKFKKNQVFQLLEKELSKNITVSKSNTSSSQFISGLFSLFISDAMAFIDTPVKKGLAATAILGTTAVLVAGVVLTATGVGAGVGIPMIIVGALGLSIGLIAVGVQAYS